MEGKSQKVFSIWSYPQKNKPNHCPSTFVFLLKVEIPSEMTPPLTHRISSISIPP